MWWTTWSDNTKMNITEEEEKRMAEVVVKSLKRTNKTLQDLARAFKLTSQKMRWLHKQYEHIGELLGDK